MIDGNEPAFAKTAQFDTHTNVLREESIGLTKREYFAAMAMQGMLMQGFSSMNQSVQDSAEWAVQAADALLTALSRTNK